MQEIVQLTYTSLASHDFSRDDLLSLLTQVRAKNQSAGITGMLLYAESSFFQVLEGPPEHIKNLINIIKKDPRHKHVTIIIKEPVAERSFGDWTMGYAQLTSQEADAILGTNDFFAHGESYAFLQPGRAKKLLEAFKEGRWRARISNSSAPATTTTESCRNTIRHSAVERSARPPAPLRSDYTFAYQPIVDIEHGVIFSHEALIRGLDQESAGHVLKQVPASAMHQFDEQARLLALRLAAHLGLPTKLNLNFLPRSIESIPTAISSLLQESEQLSLRPDQLVIEILEKELINDYDALIEVINECRSAGVIFAIDDFGSGYAGLNMLAEFQPNLIKLDMELVRGIHHKGPRQAIIRGILRTCTDLGIDIIAEGVESIGEYHWLHNEGISLFQGNLLALPQFEALSNEVCIPY